MADLSKWDFEKTFTPTQIDLLIQGIDPNDSNASRTIRGPIFQRLERAYARIIGGYVEQDDDIPWQDRHVLNDPTALKSTALRQYEDFPDDDDRMGWILGNESDFEKQTFHREDIRSWLENSGLSTSSKYDFGRGLAVKSVDELRASNAPDIDPTDLPEELDAANMAFRAVATGYGDQSATQRNRLVDYLKTHYSAFKSEQVERIATVANPDKSTGRKKRGSE